MAEPARAKELMVKSEDVPLVERVWWRAHEFFIERGSESGLKIEDWLRAEDEIRGLE